MRGFASLVPAIALLLSIPAGLALAGSTTSVAKQRVAIELIQRSPTPGQFAGTFSLVVYPGRLHEDKGTLTSVEQIVSRGTLNGQAYEIGKGDDTLKGKAGTLVIRRTDRLVAAAARYGVVTGTWSAVSGTGQYEGVTGGGREAAVTSPKAPVAYIRYEGFLTVP